MFEIVRYTADRADEWNRFVAQSKNGTFLFDRRYMDYHADRFGDFSVMCYADHGELFALLPANLKDTTLFSHQGLTFGGLVMSEKCTTAKVCQLFVELNDMLRENGVKRVVYKAVPWVYHRVPSEEDLYAIFLKCHARLSGRDVASAIRLSVPVKWKYNRRNAASRARAFGVVVERSNDFATFWKILSDNLWGKFQAHPVHTLDEILLLQSRFPEHIQLWVARSSEDVMLAGTVLYVNRDVVHSQYISASEEGKRLHAVDALYDHIIHGAYPQASFIEMGTSNMPHSNELHDSLIFQKEGFGGRAVCCDTYEWVL
jgi:hypothetical protein